MQCPFCKKEMAEGILYAKGILKWMPKEHKTSILGIFEDGSDIISDPSSKKGSTVAYKCEECGKIVMELKK